MFEAVKAAVIEILKNIVSVRCLMLYIIELLFLCSVCV